MRSLMGLLIVTGLMSGLATTSSCSSSRFGNDAPSSGKVVALDAKGAVPKDDVPETNKGGNIPPPTVITAETSSPPIPIAGSPLTCVRTADASKEVRCTYQEADGKPMDQNPTVGFMISGQDSQKTPVDLTRLGIGLYSFQIPAPLLSLTAFAVGLGSSNNDVQVSLVGKGQPDLLNVVKDSGFEEYAINDDADVLFVQQGLFRNWFGVFKGETRCLSVAPIIKIQKGGPLNVVHEGRNWAELESVCADDYTKLGGNYAMFQDVPVLKGHLYMMAFAVKHNGPVSSSQRLAVKWNEDTLLDKNVVENEWTMVRYMKVAPADGARITFDEIGASDGFGSLIDDVRIYDLGLPVLP